MQSRMVRCLLIFAIATTSASCATTPHPTLNPPPRPQFYQYNDILWNQIPKQAQDAIDSDDHACKDYIETNERRIAIHNKGSE